MSQMLPREMNYEETYSQIPDGLVSTQITLSRVNGSTFSQSSVIQFDLLSRGMFVPDSLFIRYKWTTTSAVGGSSFLGTPVYAPFARLETIVGSQIVETINQYNQVANTMVNLTQSVGSKYGMMAAYGYAGLSATPAMSEMDGRLLATAVTDTGSFSGLLPGILSNSVKLLPLFATGQVRVQLTLDTLNNIFGTTQLPTNLVLSNVELIYTMVDPGQRVEQYVRGLGTFHIKSQSFANSSVSLASGTSGTISLVFNQRLASIKSAFILFQPLTTGTNKTFDSIDPTASNGEISLNIGGISYPARPLSTLNNKSGILQYLRNAVGSLYDKDNNMAINNVEWNYLPTTATTPTEPSKFIVGIDLERLHTDSLLSGTSTENSAITLLLQSNTATNQIYNVNLILAYDAIIEIDVNSRQVSIKQ